MFGLMPVVVCTHASVSAFLYNALRKGVMPGLSRQTVLATTVCEALLVLKKVWWPIAGWLSNAPVSGIDGDWWFQFAGFTIETLLLMASLCFLYKSRAQSKKDSDELEDDFGRAQTNYLWYKIPGITRPPPAFLHWGLIYSAAVVATFITGWASSGCSLARLGAWAYRRPTAMIAIYDNYLRAFGWLPQLHISRKIGRVSSVLAFWIALLGAVDLMELINDGMELASLCYIVGDLVGLLLIVDFMAIFVKSRWLGQKSLELPMYDGV